MKSMITSVLCRRKKKLTLFIIVVYYILMEIMSFVDTECFIIRIF